MLLVMMMSNSIFSYSQLPVVGSVRDLLEDTGLSEVVVHLKNINYTTKTDKAGNFIVPAYLFGQGDSLELLGELYLRDLSLEWHFNTSIDILISSFDGKIIIQQDNLEPDGKLFLPISNGINIIRINSKSGRRVYKILSLDHTRFLSKSDQTGDNVQQTPAYDSIFFLKDDYYAGNFKINLSESNLSSVQLYYLVRHSYDDLEYFKELPNKAAFNMVSGLPAKTHLGEVESIKVLVNSDNDFVYYINTQKYLSHYDFARDQLDYVMGHAHFNATQYESGPERYLFPITLNYYKELGIYTFEFFSGDQASCNEVDWCYQRIKATSYFEDKLYFYSTNQSWDNCNQVPVITPNELYEGQNYQALNLAENYGYFRKLNAYNLAGADLQRHDLLLVNGLPIDIPVIAGIITTEFQTPLSHINVLSHNRGTPNMALKDAFSNQKLNFDDGELIYLSVQSDSFIVRSANYAEASQFWSQHEPSLNVVLEKDVSTQGLIDLNTASISDIASIGGKASNFSELIHAFTTNGKTPPVPEGYFAIPFFYYEQHLSTHHLDSYVDEMLNDPVFQSNSQYRKDRLQKLRDTIISLPLNEEFLDMITQQLEQNSSFTSYRFRSSTNAEDLEGFNGAGLYDSFTGQIGSTEKPIDAAIKQVWASLWNFTAFEEREYFKIDHRSCAMAVLVHRSFPNENANGVAITYNPYNINHAFLINAQFGDVSVVDPDPGVIYDQVLLYTYSFGNSTPYTIEYLNHSNLWQHIHGNVLTDDELYHLGDDLAIIKEYFYNHVYDCDCEFKDFGLDIEFKLDSELSPRRIYIKQVRPY